MLIRFEMGRALEPLFILGGTVPRSVPLKIRVGILLERMLSFGSPSAATSTPFAG